MQGEDRLLSAFKKDLQRIVRRHYPEWTDHNVHDPGITMLDLLAYAIDDLAYRAKHEPRKRIVKKKRK